MLSKKPVHLEFYATINKGKQFHGCPEITHQLWSVTLLGYRSKFLFLPVICMVGERFTSPRLVNLSPKSDNIASDKIVLRFYLVMFQKNSTVCENIGFRLYPFT